MFSVAAVITTYQDNYAVHRCVQSLLNQSFKLSKILIIDNSPISLVDFAGHSTIVFEHYPHNLGVAGALVRGIKWAIEHQFDYLWTFDQDSTVSSDALEVLIEYSNLLISEGLQFGILAPKVVDSETAKEYPGRHFNGFKWAYPSVDELNQDIYQCDTVITSGSLVSLKAARIVPLPNENFFIDAVDWDYCMKMQNHGFGTYVIKSVQLHHRLGASQLIKLSHRSPTIEISHYSPLRYFYICRNHTFFETRQAWLRGQIVLSIVYRFYFLFKLLFKIVFFERDQVSLKTWACTKGTFDGFMGKLGKTW